MAEKGFGVKEIKFVGSSPKIESPSNLDLSATTVAISTNATVGGNLTVSGNVSVGGTLTYEDVTNIDSVGIVTAREGVFIPDNKELKIGQTAGTPDLKIYSNGTNSYIKEQGPGSLYIQGVNVVLENTSGSNYFAGVSGAESIIYHNGNAKITTLSTGASVTGNLLIGTTAHYGGTNTQVTIGDNNTTNTGLSIAASASNGYSRIHFANGTSGSAQYAGWITYSHADEAFLIGVNESGSDKVRIQSDGSLKLLDNSKIHLGGAQNGTGDLQLYHDATHSHIKNNTGQLSIENSSGNISVKATDTNGDFILRVGGSTSSENAIVAVHNGEVILSFNGNTKLTTTNSGVTVTGGVVADGFTLGDNENIQFGDSNDLKIFHNGSHSYIADLGTGDLRITGSAVHIQNAAQSENMIRCFENGAVQLYYDNVQKLGTAGWGVQVTGISKVIDATDASGATNNFTAGTDSDLKIYHNNGANFINAVNNQSLNFATNNTLRAMFESGGHFRPTTDSTYDLGITGTRWRNVYADTLYGSGANLTNLPAPTPATTDIQVVYEVTASGSSAYLFSGNGVSGSNNEDLYLIRGQKYRFINNSGGSHPFEIRSSSGGSAYNTGVTNNGAASGNIDFAPTFDSPDQLYYQCTSHGGMVGNIYLRSAAGAYGPAFRALLTSFQVLSNATSSVIIFQSDSGTLGFDTDNCYNTSNGRFTPNRAGYYLIKGQLQFSQSTGNYRYRTRLYKNGSDFCNNQSWNDGSNSELHNPVSTIVSANGSSDYFQIVGEQHSGGNITITASNSTFFEAHFIRPL